MLHSNSTASDVSDRSAPSPGWPRTICTTQDPNPNPNPKLYR